MNYFSKSRGHLKFKYDVTDNKWIDMPNPSANKEAHFLKYPIYVGGNRRRGQIYPDWSKSNDTVYNVSATNKVNKIIRKEKGGYETTIDNASDGR